jgi:hypothetical protein
MHCDAGAIIEDSLPGHLLKPMRQHCRALFLAATAMALLLCACDRPQASRADASAIDVFSSPRQESIDQPSPIRREIDGFDLKIVLKARYTLSGIVVGTERYRMGMTGKLVPYDVAVVWGKLVEQDRYRRISWSQDDRWYVWRLERDAGFGTDMIIRNSSNNHLIPANDNLRKAIGLLKQGERAEIRGFLVEVEGKKGNSWYRWSSSLSREDSGSGSCEVIYLTGLKTGGKVYE